MMGTFFSGTLRALVAWAIVCVVPLFLVTYFGRIRLASDIAAINTTAFSSLALMASLYVSRQLVSFPGTRQLTQSVLAAFAGFGLVAAILLLLRLPYSIVLFLYSLVTTAILLVVWRKLSQPVTRNNFHIVPFGGTSHLKELDITLTWMSEPIIPEAPDASIAADLRADLPAEWERMLTAAALRGIPVYHVKLLQESIAGKVFIEHLSENNLGSLIPNQSYSDVKSVADRVFAALLLPILALPMLLVALVIRMQDGGPALFSQPRIGLGGKPFTIWKFRSMTHRPASARETRKTSITLDNDARITRFGALIRKYRIDELPQLFNILRGDMSFIGPRPEAIALAEWYNRELPFYSYRHIVRPGLTGWAQVNQGHVADLDGVDYKLQYDFFYIKYFSFWLDVLIVLRTIRTILTGFGSR